MEKPHTLTLRLPVKPQSRQYGVIARRGGWLGQDRAHTRTRSSSLWQQAQVTLRSRGSLFNKWSWNEWASTGLGKKNLNMDVTFFTKANSKRITDLNIKLGKVRKSTELLEKNTQENLGGPGHGDGFRTQCQRKDSQRK